MRTGKPEGSRCYFLCLLDWRNFLLSKEQIDRVASALDLPLEPAEPPTGWHVGPCTAIRHEAVRGASVGVTHSRIIFQVDLINMSIKDFWQIRRIRDELEPQITAILQGRVIPAMQGVLPQRGRSGAEGEGPRIFVYPVFEVRRSEPFWSDLLEEKPYNIPTTCFHARLQDLEAKGTVKMRASGAKIIATEMSNRFFWELVNVVYYQGLYRQSRESVEIFPAGRVHRGLENRLEDFGREFATTFYQLGSGAMLERLNFRLLIFTLTLVLLTVISVGVSAATLVVALANEGP